VIEQRKNQRFDLHLPFEIMRGAIRSKSKGETRNLSSSGVLFSSPAPMEIGAPIEYLITLPKVPGTRAEVRLRCMGKVVRSEIDSAFAATLERYEFLRQRI
jgi:hypothetical protein